MLATLAIVASMVFCQQNFVLGDTSSPYDLNQSQCRQWLGPGKHRYPITAANGGSAVWAQFGWGSVASGLKLQYVRFGCVDVWARRGLHVKVNRCAELTRIYIWRTRRRAPPKALVSVWGLGCHSLIYIYGDCPVL